MKVGAGHVVAGLAFAALLLSIATVVQLLVQGSP